MSFLVSSMFFLFFFIVFQMNYTMTWSFPFHYFFSSNFNNFSFGMALDHISSFFVFMVLLVTFFVSSYSQVYMEHYNNKKFLTLLILFLVSMIVMALSDSFLVLMIGWDFLGISSICLIMFYPNKITLFNSLMTMFFNRVGDVLLIIILSFTLLNFCCSFFFNQHPFFIFLLFLLCGFTKSAQFPMSAWLPAAMSAPTPISAMVHSSTLVTAGIFLVQKLSFCLEYWSLLSIICYFSFLSFLLGGLMANLEPDLKKMVAFSTMSQISMIMIFLSLFFSILAMAHMFFHALFKTLLFCCSGMIFLFHYSAQTFKFFTAKNNSLLMMSMFFLSVYSMSGLMFSSSFYTKDMVLEILVYEGISLYLFALTLGSSLTLLYCSKMLFSSFSWNASFFYSQEKSFNFFLFLMFSAAVLMSGKVMKLLFWCDMILVLNWQDLSLVLLSIIIPSLLCLHNFKPLNFFLFMTLEVSFSKFFSYSLWKNLELGYLQKVGLSEVLFFKPSHLVPEFYLSFFKNKSFILLFLLTLILFLKP